MNNTRALLERSGNAFSKNNAEFICNTIQSMVEYENELRRETHNGNKERMGRI